MSMSATATSHQSNALAESRSLLDELVSPVASATTKHRLQNH